MVLPPIFFPPMQKILRATLDLVTSASSLTDVALTYLRILVFLGVAFLVATLAGITAANVRAVRTYGPFRSCGSCKRFRPYAGSFSAILWFKEADVRLGFVVRP